MDFDIEPGYGMKEENTILLPLETRRELGILLGQFLELSTEGSRLVLQVGKNPYEGSNSALVSPRNFEKIRSREVQFRLLEVTVGCDPEFFILWKNRLISAVTYLPFAGKIGSDGNLGELRPQYDKHEEGVVQNISRLVSKIPRTLKRSDWAKGYPEDGRNFSYQAHSYFLGMPAGFHVHLGIPPEILNTRKEFNLAAMNHIVKCLDWYVSVPLVPLEESHVRRIGKTKYGNPGDYRPSGKTLEYRTPGGFYLRTPSLARGLMGLSLLVAEAVVSRMKEESRGFVNLPKLGENDFQRIMPLPRDDFIQEVLRKEDVSLAKRHVEKIRKELENLPNYHKHKESTEGLFREVEEGMKPSPDLIQNWKEAT